MYTHLIILKATFTSEFCARTLAKTQQQFNAYLRTAKFPSLTVISDGSTKSKRELQTFVVGFNDSILAALPLQYTTTTKSVLDDNESLPMAALQDAANEDDRKPLRLFVSLYNMFRLTYFHPSRWPGYLLLNHQ